jgi:hypothetical protein
MTNRKPAQPIKRTKSGKVQKRRGDGHTGAGVNRYWCTLPMERVLLLFLSDWMAESPDYPRKKVCEDADESYFMAFPLDDNGEPWAEDTRKHRQVV